MVILIKIFFFSIQKLWFHIPDFGPNTSPFSDQNCSNCICWEAKLGSAKSGEYDLIQPILLILFDLETGGKGQIEQ